jgi:dTDP-4-dehydrorhamnose reductase
MPKILLTGCNGQVGFELQRSLAPFGEVTAFDRSRCDLADPESLRSAVREVRPNLIVKPAAYTAVDKAESDEATAHAVNAIAPGIIGEEAAKLGALVIQYSTDYVFDGAKDSPYVETDPTNPLSVYGRTKLAGEQALAASGARHLIFRTSWVFGAHGANFLLTNKSHPTTRKNNIKPQSSAGAGARWINRRLTRRVREWERPNQITRINTDMKK